MARSSSSSPAGASEISQPLNQEEKDLSTKYYPLLVKVASIVAPQYEDAISEGFAGLVAGLRTYRPDGGASLETWLSKQIRFAILKGLAAERAHRMPSIDADDEFDVVDHRGQTDADIDDMLNAIGELPDHLAELVWAYLGTGNLDRAAKALGLKRAVARERLATAKRILQNPASKSL